jgi:hypothetical protein
MMESPSRSAGKGFFRGIDPLPGLPTFTFEQGGRKG